MILESLLRKGRRLGLITKGLLCLVEEHDLYLLERILLSHSYIYIYIWYLDNKSENVVYGIPLNRETIWGWEDELEKNREFWKIGWCGNMTVFHFPYLKIELENTVFSQINWLDRKKKITDISCSNAKGNPNQDWN